MTRKKAPNVENKPLQSNSSKKLPNLDGSTVTADPLHCQKKTARLIAEKGGDYFIQIKANQKNPILCNRK